MPREFCEAKNKHYRIRVLCKCHWHQIQRWQEGRDTLSEHKLVNYKLCKQDAELIYNAVNFYQNNKT